MPVRSTGSGPTWGDGGEWKFAGTAGPSSSWHDFFNHLEHDIARQCGIPDELRARAPKKETPELAKIVGGFCSHVSALGWQLRLRGNAYLWNGPGKQVSGKIEYSGPTNLRSRHTDLAMVCVCLAEVLGLAAFARGLTAELKAAQQKAVEAGAAT